MKIPKQEVDKNNTKNHAILVTSRRGQFTRNEESFLNEEEKEERQFYVESSSSELSIVNDVNTIKLHYVNPVVDDC